MSIDGMRVPPPKQDLTSAANDVVRIWQLMAEQAAHIASSRRTLFKAYVSEGFTEAQALELIKVP